MKIIMTIRRAENKDIKKISDLLNQVGLLHHKGRPDIFKSNAKKYSEEELERLINDSSRPIFVAADENDCVLGYVFCIFEQHTDSSVLNNLKTLYIDDLCVDENARGCRIGRQLYNFVADFAEKNGCSNLTLNVWSFNESAIKFYEACGLKPQRIFMEKIFD